MYIHTHGTFKGMWEWAASGGGDTSTRVARDDHPHWRTEGVEVSPGASLCVARCVPINAIAVQKKTISLAGKRSRTYDSRGSGWQFILKHLHLCRICGKHLPSCPPKNVVHDNSKLLRSLISVWILWTQEHPAEATHRLWPSGNESDVAFPEDEMRAAGSKFDPRITSFKDVTR